LAAAAATSFLPRFFVAESAAVLVRPEVADFFLFPVFFLTSSSSWSRFYETDSAEIYELKF
jgi:hypothetical protein